jgi:phage terminase large subunit-like protein
LKDSAKITATTIEFLSTGATITAIPSDYRGAAGGNQHVTSFDEVWGATSESAIRLWDELVPPPTRKVALRLTTSYAGFESESTLLENLYKRGLRGTPTGDDFYEQPGMLMYWTHECRAPWQTQEWRNQMREQLRPNAYLRLIENRFASTESEFIDMAWFDQCVDHDRSPILLDRFMPVFFGVDASTKRDSTAICGCTFDAVSKKIVTVIHKTWQPSQSDPLDFESTIESALLDFKKRFHMRQVFFDPWQMASCAQRLTKLGIPMVEFPQTVSNLTEASQNLFDLFKGNNIVLYPDQDFRTAISHCIAKETSRGWRIGKERQSFKIDLAVSLAQAALAALKAGYQPRKRPARAW